MKKITAEAAYDRGQKYKEQQEKQDDLPSVVKTFSVDRDEEERKGQSGSTDEEDYAGKCFHGILLYGSIVSLFASFEK